MRQLIHCINFSEPLIQNIERLLKDMVVALELLRNNTSIFFPEFL
jgi:hypothetical protein